MKEEAERLQKSKMTDKSKETVSSRHSMIHAYMSSHSPEWNVFTKALASRLMDIGGKGSGKRVRTRGDRCLQGNSVFQAQQDGG